MNIIHLEEYTNNDGMLRGYLMGYGVNGLSAKFNEVTFDFTNVTSVNKTFIIGLFQTLLEKTQYNKTRFEELYKIVGPDKIVESVNDMIDECIVDFENETVL